MTQANPAPNEQDREPMRGLLSTSIGSIRIHFAIAFLFSAAVNVLFLASPLYMMQLYGRVLDSQSIETLISLSVALCLALIAMAAADAARSRLLVRAGARIDRLLTPATVRCAMSDGNGETKRAVEDVETVRRFLTSGSATTLMDAPFTLLFLVVLYLLHPMLGLVATLGSVVILLTAGLARLLQARREAKIGEGSRKIEVMSAGLDIDRGEIRALGLERGLSARLADEHERVGSLQLAASELTASVGAISRFVRLAAHSGALATGAVLALDGALAPSAMLAGAILAGRALGPIESLSTSWRQGAGAREAMRRIDGRLDGHAEGLTDALATRSSDRPGAALEVRRLVVAEPGKSRAVLRALSFDIAQGETVAVAGPSGAGKSTLARCLAGAERPQAGTIRLDQIDIGTAAPEVLGDLIGWLPQEARLFPGTVRENIARFGPASDAEIVAAARLAGAEDVISRLAEGYGTVVGPDGANLAAGTRQLIAFARTLLRKPALLILDQPTAHLDAAGELAVINAIRHLKAAGVTIMLVCHKPVLASLADRLMLLKEGTVELYEERETVVSAIRRRSIHAVETGAEQKTEAGTETIAQAETPRASNGPAAP